jgi:hypothetical protein
MLPANKYPGRCARCFAHVPEGSGVLADVVLLDTVTPESGPKYAYFVQNHARAVYCAGCAAHRNQTALPPEGHYAVHDRNGKLQFFKLARYPRSVTRDTRNPRRGTVSPSCKLVLGGTPDTPIDGEFAFELVTRALVNPAGAALRYARELGRCSRCNRHLTDEASRARGLGPECASR